MQRKGLLVGLLVVTMITALQFQLSITSVPLTPNLFGHRSTSMFDIWIVGHLLLGVLLCGSFTRIYRTNQPGPLLLPSFSFIVAWEVVELGMEFGLFGASIQNWKDGYEHWTNRYIADPLLGICGFFLCHRFPRIFWPSVILAMVWELVQVLSPTSMFIQNWLFG